MTRAGVETLRYSKQKNKYYHITIKINLETRKN